MFKNAIVRKPSKSISDGITSREEGKPDYDKALAQHADYIAALKETGVNVTVLEALDDYPDACFIEDVALCTSKCAIVTNPGAESRKGEAQQADLKEALENFYEHVEYIEEPGTVEAGDIMMIGDHFYIGKSDRTNSEGIKQMLAILDKYGLSGEEVPMQEMLHLKTGLSYLENNNLLTAGEFQSYDLFKDFNRINVPGEEDYAANSIWMNDYVIVPEGYPIVKSEVEKLGYKVLTVDTSEYRKIDGGLSCLSLRF